MGTRYPVSITITEQEKGYSPSSSHFKGILEEQQKNWSIFYSGEETDVMKSVYTTFSCIDDIVTLKREGGISCQIQFQRMQTSECEYIIEGFEKLQIKIITTTCETARKGTTGRIRLEYQIQSEMLPATERIITVCFSPDRRRTI